MKATGIIRRVDDLGRIVLPKDFRQRLAIREGQPLEMVIVNGVIIMGKVDESEVTEVKSNV